VLTGSKVFPLRRVLRKFDPMTREFLLFLALPAAIAAAELPLPEKPEYNRDVRPILADACFRCHGFDKNKRKAGRRLDLREGALAENDGVRAIVPGRPDQSVMIARMDAADPEDHMPPPDEVRQLTAREKEILKRWIQQGAEYQDHWAYIPPVRPAVPATDRAVNAIDAFVGSRLAQIGLTPAPEADRVTLARRLYFDLTGLPPLPQEVEAFANDAAPDAFDKLADKLLAGEPCAERMAMWWLDQVRYADSAGYHSDNPIPVWPYRDYVIRAFHANKRFDRFALEQVAGDLLPDATRETRVGSAYNRLILSTEEGGAQPKQYEAKYLTDRVKSIGTTWLGQTFMCAECHDHKYDPVTSRDFYSVGAFFADIEEPSVGNRGKGTLLADEAQRAKLKELDDKLAALKSRDDKDPEKTAAKKARDDYENSIPHCLTTIASQNFRTVRILPRGDWQNESGEVVLPATPKFLPGYIESGKEKRLTRLDLAQWLVSRQNPLTARVVMNRLWKLFYGAGLVKTLDDMGTQSEAPVQQPLLDWLACEFMESGWNVRHMLRLMVTSHTYRQSSVGTPESLARDARNLEFARGGRWRLDAEFVRDNALAISGLLVRRVGGPSVNPYQPAGYWENLNFPVREWQNSKDENQWRRGIYTWWQRSYVHPAMLAFDAPTREECAPDRTRSNIPQQALVLLNDTTFVEAARAFAARILKEGGSGDTARLEWAWRQATLREPGRDELLTLATLLGKHRAKFHLDKKSAAAAVNAGYSKPPEDLNTTELAAWMSVARVILNLHETVTRP
jgi:hypothetical protein